MNKEYGLCYQVIEDNHDFQLLIQLKLKGEPRLKFGGAATNAIEAVELVRSTDCKLLILDHFIEGEIMGLAAAPLIKAANPEIKIILFTSHDLASEASREPTIDAYLQKKDLNKLLPTILRLLGMDSPPPPGQISVFPLDKH